MLLPRPAVHALFALVLVGAGAHAARAELLTGDEVVLGRGEVVPGNFYASGGVVTIRGDVIGDAVLAGGAVTVEGRVHGDVLAFGGQLLVLGRVDGDVRMAGGDVAVLGPVGGDALLGGGTVQLSGTVDGDAFVAGGAASLGGDIGGALLLAGGDSRIAGRVGDGVVAHGGRLRLDDGARIDGDLWSSGDALERALGAVVTGEVIETPRTLSGTAVRGAGFIGWLQGLVGMSLLGLLWLLPFRSFATRAMSTLRARPGVSFGMGTAVAIAAPFALVIVMLFGALLGGWWIALFGFALYALAFALGAPLVAALLGRELLMKPMRTNTEAVPMILFLAALAGLQLVPVVGPLLVFGAALCGAGALAVTVKETFWPAAAVPQRPSSPPVAPPL